MGFNASGNGTLRLRLPSCLPNDTYHKGEYWDGGVYDPFWWVQNALKSVGFYKVERTAKLSDGTVNVELDYSSGYQEDKILGVLKVLSPYTTAGTIYFYGCDDRWRFQFAAGKWEEQRGVVHYSSQRPFPPFRQTDKTLAALMSRVQSRAGYIKDTPEQRARTLLTAFEEQDPDGVLRALTGCGLKDFLAELGVEDS